MAFRDLAPTGTFYDFAFSSPLSNPTSSLTFSSYGSFSFFLFSSGVTLRRPFFSLLLLERSDAFSGGCSVLELFLSPLHLGAPLSFPHPTRFLLLSKQRR